MVLKQIVEHLGKGRLKITLEESAQRKTPRNKKEKFRDLLSGKLIQMFKERFDENSKDYGCKHEKMLGQSRHLISVFEKEFPDKFEYYFKLWDNQKVGEFNNLFESFKESLLIKFRSVSKDKKNVVVEFNLDILKKRIKSVDKMNLLQDIYKR